MEDEFTVVTDTKNIKKSTSENYAFFGVFDGNYNKPINNINTS